MWKILYFLNNNQIKHSIINNNSTIDIKLKEYDIIVNEVATCPQKRKRKEYILKCKNGIIVSESDIDTFITKLINCDYAKKFANN